MLAFAQDLSADNKGVAMKYSFLVLTVCCTAAGGLTALAEDTPKWTEFTSSEKDFAAQFPGKPSRQVKETEKATTTSYMVPARTGAYLVARQSYSVDVGKGRTVQQLLDMGRDGGVSKSGGKLLSEKKIKLQDRYLGRDLRIESPDGKFIMRARVYWVNPRMYFVSVTGTAEFVDTRDADRFLDSFRVVEAK